MGATKMSDRQPPLPATGKGADRKLWHYVLNVLNVQSVISDRERGQPARQNTRQVGANRGSVDGGRREDRGRRDDSQSGKREDRADTVLRQLPRGQVVSIGGIQETKLSRCTNYGGRTATLRAKSTVSIDTPAAARAAQRQPSGQRSTAGKPKRNPKATRSLKGQRTTQEGRFKHRKLHFILPVRNGAVQSERSGSSKRRAGMPAEGLTQEDNNLLQEGRTASRVEQQRQLGGSSSKARKKELPRATTHSINRKNRNRIRKDMARRRW